MARGEINLLCSEIDTLLTDICKFLNEELKNESISEKGRTLASMLIERSKVQLKAISKITSVMETSDPVNESYVDMQGPKVTDSPTDHQEIYSDVSFEAASTFSVMDDATVNGVCPYDNLPATDIREGKFGSLYRKERFLFFDQQRKIFAAIQQSWFLIYFNEHATKPSQTFDLTGYSARPSSTKDIKKWEESFSLVSLTDSKSYQFTALTSKDMLQWVSAINIQSELMQTKRSLPPIPATIVITVTPNVRESESSNDYEPLTEYRLKNEPTLNLHQKTSQSNLTKKPLPLPPRNSPSRTPKTIELASSDESMGDYDCVGQAPEDSFSDADEEDAVYDNPAELKQSAEYTNRALETTDANDDDEIYDYLQHPNQNSDSSQLINNSPSISEKIKNDQQENHSQDVHFKEIQKPILKPKLLSFSHKRKYN